jgi:hypothetical protein
MNTLAKINPKEFGLEENQVLTIEQAFLPKITERDGLSKVYELLIVKEITKESCNEAYELRKKLVKVRTGIADIHKTQKAFFLRAGQFVDAWKNKETLPVEQMEEKLSEMEKHFEKLEAEKIAKIESERKAEIGKYTTVLPFGLGVMEESVYQNYIIGVKLSYEARIKAEQEAETERLKLIEVEKETARLKAIEDERIRKENEALKAEAIERERLTQERIAQEEKERKAKEAEFERKLKEESDKIEAERKKQAEILAKQKQEAEAKAEAERKRQADELAKQKAESDRKQKEIEEKARKEREAIEEKNRIEREKAEAERKRLENELFAKQQDELKAKQEAERIEKERIALENKKAKAPDKEKLSKMIEDLVLTVPELKKEESETVINLITYRFEGFKKWAKEQIENI